MCIEVRISYPRCSHIHRGYELCVDINSKQICCSSIQTQPRIDLFCPQCAKLKRRAYRLESTRAIRAQQVSQLTAQTETNMDSKQIQGLWQSQQQARQDFGDSKQVAAKCSNGSTFDRSVSGSSLYWQIPKLDTYISPPLLLEPPIDPLASGPPKFLEYLQKAAMVVALDSTARRVQDYRRP